MCQKKLVAYFLHEMTQSENMLTAVGLLPV